MPARLKIDIHNYVDNATAVGLDLERSVADADVHLRVLHRDANEVAPATGPGWYLVTALDRPRQQHASKHPNPAGRTIAGIWNYLSDFAGLTSASRPPALHCLIDSNGSVYEKLLHRCDRGSILRHYGEAPRSGAPRRR